VYQFAASAQVSFAFVFFKGRTGEGSRLPHGQLKAGKQRSRRMRKEKVIEEPETLPLGEGLAIQLFDLYIKPVLLNPHRGELQRTAVTPNGLRTRSDQAFIFLLQDHGRTNY
jgi:hypothetical protein